MRAFIIVIGVLLGSCHGNKTGSGVVLDAQTQMPLDSVAYRVIGEEAIYYTDSIGQYFVNGPNGGCFPDCPDFTAEFTESDYETIRIGNPDGEILLQAE